VSAIRIVTSFSGQAHGQKIQYAEYVFGDPAQGVGIDRIRQMRGRSVFQFDSPSAECQIQRVIPLYS